MLNHGVVAERIVRKSPYGVMYRRGEKVFSSAYSADFIL